MTKIFHRLVTPDEARDIISSLIRKKISSIRIPIKYATNQIVSEDVYSEIDIPPFDRSEVDGYAVIHSSLEGAEEDNPVTLKLKGEIEIGKRYEIEILPGETLYIPTGAILPRGADSIAMVENTSRDGDYIRFYRSVSPGENISHAGSDFSFGEVLAHPGTLIDPEVIALLSAAGKTEISVFKKIKVAVFSSGNEIKEPGEYLNDGEIYDVNSHYFVSALNNTGLVEAEFVGIIRDDKDIAVRTIEPLLLNYDVIMSSGSTSAGFHDMLYEVVDSLDGKMLFHGISIKPGKPTFVAEVKGSAFIGMPGFPLSSASVLNYIVIPGITKAYNTENFLIKKMKIPFRINGERGKDYLIPGIISRNNRVYPIFGDSGSISRMVYSDGIMVLSKDRNFYEENEEVDFFTMKKREKDVLCIGSNDPLLERILFRTFRQPAIVNAGSMGGVEAMRIGESDIGGIHLMKDGIYNKFVMDENMKKNAVLIRGFSREQGFVSQNGISSFREIVDGNMLFVNRNRGSGTRDLIESLIKEELGGDFKAEKIRGYFWEAKSHGAVSRAVKQGRADVGISIKYYASMLELKFHKIKDENYDILISKNFYDSEHGRLFISNLKDIKELEDHFPGYIIGDDIGRRMI